MSAYEIFLKNRGIESPCDACQGLGVRLYNSGATWRGGMGTAQLERDICDSCWGSGDELRPWLNLRLRDEETKFLVETEAAKLFSERSGAYLNLLKPAIRELSSVIHKHGQERRRRPEGWSTVCTELAQLLVDLTK